MDAAKVRDFWQKHRQDLEQVPCDLCGSHKHRKLNLPEKHGVGAQLVQCIKCGLLYLNPRWNSKTYDALYHYVYRSRPDKKKFDKELEKHLPAAARILRIATNLRGGKQWQNVLDIGCGYGSLLWIAKHLYGANVSGFEPDNSLVEFCQPILGGGVLSMSIEEGIGKLISDGNKFDLIACQQSLNHLLYPVTTLRSLRELLTPDGLLLLEVLDFVTYTKIKGQRIQVDHTHYFTSRTLETALHTAGFMTLFTESDTVSGEKGKSLYFLPNRHIRNVSCVRLSSFEGLLEEMSPDEELKLIDILLKETTPSAFGILTSKIRGVKYLFTKLLR